MKRIRLENIQVSQDVIDEILSQSPDLSEEDKATVVATIKRKGLFKYKSTLLNVMRSPLGQHLSIEEVERSLPIIEELKSTEEEGVLELDDKDFEYMEQKLAAVRFDGFDDRWVRLKHVVKNATKNLLELENGSSNSVS